MELSENRELGKPPVMPMLPQPKRNITNKLKMRRTRLELLEELWLTEDSLTIHQLGKSTIRLHPSPKKRKKRKKEEMLFHIPHLNHTNRRKNP